MGDTFDYVPVQLTKAFREAQSDANFRGWLKMQEAAVDIEFMVFDVPEIRDEAYTKDSLTAVEAKLVELYPDARAAFTGDENIHRSMRFVYYVGETFRRAFEGTWVALPPQDPGSNAHMLQPAIDLPFREGFVKPMDQLRFALNRRTGGEITRVYTNMQRLYDEWVQAGRPPREFRGTLREDE